MSYRLKGSIGAVDGDTNKGVSYPKMDFTTLNSSQPPDPNFISMSGEETGNKFGVCTWDDYLASLPDQMQVSISRRGYGKVGIKIGLRWETPTQEERDNGVINDAVIKTNAVEIFKV